MITRRNILLGFGGIALAGGSFAAGVFDGAMQRKHSKQFHEDLADMLDLLDKGCIAAIAAVVVLPLSELQPAHQRVKAGEALEKLVLGVTDQ